MGFTRRKTGKSFEKLVSCINEHLHKIAIVTPNDKLVDKDTGEKRQIDITIRISDGPSNFLGIIEVRDRSRPVGKEYIEQISSKRKSVGANSACIVSKSGFWKSAQKKAKSLGISIYSYQEAIKTDWTGFFSLMKDFSVVTRRFDKVIVVFLKKGSKKIINPHPELRKNVQDDGFALVLTNEKGKPSTSIKKIAEAVINPLKDEIYNKMSPGDPPVRNKIHYSGELRPPLFFRDEDGNVRPVEDLLIVVDMWLEEKKFPISVQQYKELETGQVHAEVLSSEVEIGNENYEAQFIALEPTKFRTQETKMLIRLKKKKQDS